MDQQWLAMRASYMDFNVRNVLFNTALPEYRHNYFILAFSDGHEVNTSSIGARAATGRCHSNRGFAFL